MTFSLLARLYEDHRAAVLVQAQRVDPASMGGRVFRGQEADTKQRLKVLLE